MANVYTWLLVMARPTKEYNMATNLLQLPYGHLHSTSKLAVISICPGVVCPGVVNF